MGGWSLFVDSVESFMGRCIDRLVGLALFDDGSTSPIGRS